MYEQQESQDHQSQPGPPPTLASVSKPGAGRLRFAVAAALVVTVAGTAAALPSLANATEDSAASVRQSPADGSDLGSVTLDELADELAELGLTVSIDADTEDADIDDATTDDADHDADQNDGTDEEPLGSFPVDGDRINLDGARDAKVAAQAKEIWSRFVELIPADQRQMVSAFELVPEEFGGAYVYPDEADPSRWVLGVGLGLGDDLDAVLIHEFGHLLTLNASQVPPDPDADGADCDTYFTGEGCALSSSTMAEFVARFWPQDRIDEIDRIQQSEDYEAFDEFYNEHADEFVTDYATTNPAEDLAETFMTFVLNERPDGDTIADQKVELLWNDPAMVELRSQIQLATRQRP